MTDMKKEKPKEDVEAAEDVETEETERIEDVIEPVLVEKEAEEPIQHQLMRMKADFDNYRKRQIRERAEWIVRANEDLFLELLPVLDHYEMGLKSAAEHKADPSVIEGFKLVYDQLLDVLKKSNVTPIETIDQTFDPHHHEALTNMPSDKPAETIVEECRKGYMLGEKLLRAAQVVVSSGPLDTNGIKD